MSNSFYDERFDVPQTDENTEYEKSRNELFWECEDNSSEAINYVHELEAQIREAKELLKVYIDECGQMTNGIVKSRFSKILKVLK
jgi:6-phosphogluconolactonase/glucosamine-6-phosphate isomerase/deaminase